MRSEWLIQTNILSVNSRLRNIFSLNWSFLVTVRVAVVYFRMCKIIRCFIAITLLLSNIVKLQCFKANPTIITANRRLYCFCFFFYSLSCLSSYCFMFFCRYGNRHYGVNHVNECNGDIECTTEVIQSKGVHVSVETNAQVPKVSNSIYQSFFQ